MFIYIHDILYIPFFMQNLSVWNKRICQVETRSLIFTKTDNQNKTRMWMKWHQMAVISKMNIAEMFLKIKIEAWNVVSICLDFHFYKCVIL